MNFWKTGLPGPKVVGQRFPQALLISATITLILLIPLTYYSVKFFQQANENRIINEVVQTEVARLKAQLVELNVTHLANKFEGNRFFFPSNVDWRGRVYNIPSFLNVQNADPSRGLLQFFRSERVKTEEQAEWLAIHGANTYGNDKVTFDEMQVWASEHHDLIEDSATQPFDGFQFWASADSPLEFLQTCMEWTAATGCDNHETFLS